MGSHLQSEPKSSMAFPPLNSTRIATVNDEKGRSQVIATRQMSSEVAAPGTFSMDALHKIIQGEREHTQSLVAAKYSAPDGPDRGANCANSSGKRRNGPCSQRLSAGTGQEHHDGHPKRLCSDAELTSIPEPGKPNEPTAAGWISCARQGRR